ncbi:hypothetical protein BAAM0499_05985 [Bifidobacterium animalis subsp. animalis MCC 0499]|uniref:hypothetical protein n=1 Tax=Bifidobacterium animalis TaxID=28025 RepID=UPI00069BB57A|nr:hypothetical protein [Bifidobacterium animalis]KOA61166.1 hypothetical protein BAAM0499_05985 [Bifidobacterium animalis subsp. animalis MCC 0499]
MQNDLGRRLRVGDALALVYRQAHDPESLITDRLSRHHKDHEHAQTAQARQMQQQEMKAAAKDLNPAFANLFT